MEHSCYLNLFLYLILHLYLYWALQGSGEGLEQTGMCEVLGKYFTYLRD